MENYSADIMHDVLEGWMNREIAVVLNRLCDTTDLTLAIINKRLNSFGFGSLDINQPVAIKPDKFKERDLKQNASQMFTLYRLLPFMIADLIPLNHPAWELYLSLCEICDIIFAPEISPQQCADLEILIEDHFKQFVSEFPEEALTPKAHHIIHYPRILLMMGPLVHQWCMRYIF